MAEIRGEKIGVGRLARSVSLGPPNHFHKLTPLAEERGTGMLEGYVRDVEDMARMVKAYDRWLRNGTEHSWSSTGLLSVGIISSA